MRKYNYLILICFVFLLNASAFIQAEGFDSLGIRLGYTSARGIGRTPGYGTVQAFYSPQPKLGSFAPYLDGRGHYLENGKWAANAGIGLQFAPSCGGSLWRVYGFYDFLEAKHNFNQLSWGFERIGRVFDFRANAYYPVEYRGYSHKTHYFFRGGFRATSYDRHKPMQGYDAEISRCIELCDWLKFYTSIGTYYFKVPHDESAFGGKLRLETELYRGLIIGVQGTYDDHFKTCVQGQISYTFPLSRLACGCEDSCLYPVQRQEIIVTHRHCRWRANY